MPDFRKVRVSSTVKVPLYSVELSPPDTEALKCRYATCPKYDDVSRVVVDAPAVMKLDCEVIVDPLTEFIR